MAKRKLDLATDTGLMVEGGALHDVLSDRSSGAKLRAELLTDGLPYDIVRLVDEAARLSDRLDAMNRILSGDADLWLSITEVRGGLLELRVDNTMSEARQTAGVLRQLLAEVNRRIRDLGKTDGDGADPTAGL